MSRPHLIRKRSLLAKLKLTLVLIFLFPLFLASAAELARIIGLRKTAVPVVGTGSMYPSLYWDKSEGGPEDERYKTIEEHRSTPLMYRYFPEIKFGKLRIKIRTIGHSDMIAFKNQKTREILLNEGKDPEAGFIKRIVGVAGDKLEVRDGYLIVNGNSAVEPYIKEPRSTYGGAFLPDCTQISVPDGYVFVLGDNRKLSSDSRSELGFVALDDISYVLPIGEQGIYFPQWRDTTKDDELAGKPTIDISQFLSQINNLRSNSGVSPLKTNQALTKAAELRGRYMLGTRNYAVGNNLNGYSMSDAHKEAGYNNVLVGEFVSHGYYTADELFNNLTYFNETKSQIINSKYQEIGVSVVNGEVKGCPTQIIVGELGGYIPADYSPEIVESWKSLIESLNRVIPSWESARNDPQVDQSKLEKLISLLYARKTLATEVYDTMVNRRWLTEEQQARMELDDQTATAINELILDLNSE